MTEHLPQVPCSVWVEDGAQPCYRPAVEVLNFFNPLCGGGDLAVCGPHLVEYLEESLLSNPAVE